VGIAGSGRVAGRSASAGGAIFAQTCRSVSTSGADDLCLGGVIFEV
jgi:hypothetical protein